VATVFASPAELISAVGTDLGTTDWLMITQERVDQFAEATGDHQWIHTDPERAKDGPFGGTIAHGYLTLSLVNHFLPDLLEVRGISMGINYGTDRVRFPAPVPVGSRIRARAQLSGADEVPGGVQARVTVSVEVEGQDKPACVVETLSRFLAS
jgi:acyl dehydratase